MDEIVGTDGSYVLLDHRLTDLHLDCLELNVGEVRFYLEVERLLLVYNQSPNAVFLSLVPLSHKQELRKEVFLRLCGHDY